MKQVVENYLDKYGKDKDLPPWQAFTIPHQPGSGNLHIIQKLFEGPFEVKLYLEHLFELR